MRTIELWESGAPGALGNGPEDRPALTLLSEVAGESKPAFVVFPGGGYGGLASHESQPVAEWFESIGIRGLVLRYRLGPRYHHPVMLNDAQRAVRVVRHHAAEWGIDPQRVGILGFSAGGHLASTLSTHHALGTPDAADPVEAHSSRPDASVLIYPVITLLTPYGHQGSRQNLLGSVSDELALGLCNERNVALDTPPTFLCHGADDTVVPIQNALMYSTALAEHHIPFELHVPQRGPHGFGMGAAGSPTDWRPAAEKWLRARGF